MSHACHMTGHGQTGLVRTTERAEDRRAGVRDREVAQSAGIPPQETEETDREQDKTRGRWWGCM